MPPMDSDDSLDISQITGNASDDIKRAIGKPAVFFQIYPVENHSTTAFGRSILKRMKTVEISLNRNAEVEKKMEGRVVIELDVANGQYILNPYYAL